MLSDSGRMRPGGDCHVRILTSRIAIHAKVPGDHDLTYPVLPCNSDRKVPQSGEGDTAYLVPTPLQVCRLPQLRLFSLSPAPRDTSDLVCDKCRQA